jgi:hypothetical protein
VREAVSDARPYGDPKLEFCRRPLGKDMQISV